MNWKDINMQQFVELQEAIGKTYHNPEDKTFAIARILFRKDITQEPITTLQGYYNQMSELIEKAVPDADVKKEYTLNGNKYTLHRDIEKMTTAQYIDFTNSANRLIDTIACFIVPSGHKYNDGYDMAAVKNDIKTGMNAEEGNAILFFIVKQLKNCIERLVCYSAAEMLMMKKASLSKRIAMTKKLLQGWLNLEPLILP